MDIPRYLITLFMGFICLTNEAQTIYTCNGKYRIGISDKLELQNSELNTVRHYKAIGGKVHVNVKTSSSFITFQQKGLNADIKDSYNKYCRVIVNYYQDNRSDSVYGCGDQIVVDRDLLYAVHSSVQESCNKNKTPLLKFINIQPLKINGFPVLYYSYKRKGWEGNQSPVIVNVYQIFNRYESVILTFSYREAEREMWKSFHNNITESFSFIKIY